MKTAILFFLSGNFFLFIAGAFALFSRPRDAFRQRNKNSLWVAGSMLCLGWLVSKEFPLHLFESILGFAFLGISLLLFLWTAWINRRNKLTPIYSTDQPRYLMQSGPYQYVRHPYYSAYLLTFVGGGILSRSPWAYVILLLVLHIYTSAADQEEEKFLNSPLAEAYRSYKKTTGKFFPYL
ncbi:MAG: isoprenylcysteine carboxylmethyltransferase family protein [Bacteroidota bacterium]